MFLGSSNLIKFNIKTRFRWLYQLFLTHTEMQINHSGLNILYKPKRQEGFRMFALVVQDAYLRHISKSKCGRYLSLKTSFALNYRNFESSILKKIAVTIKPVYRGDAVQCKPTTANNFLRSPKPQSKTHRESFTQRTREPQLMPYYRGHVLCVPRKNIQ